MKTVFDYENELLNKCVSLWEENPDNGWEENPDNGLPLLLQTPTWFYKSKCLDRFSFLSKVLDIGKRCEILKPYIQNYLNSRHISLQEK